MSPKINHRGFPHFAWPRPLQPLSPDYTTICPAYPAVCAPAKLPAPYGAPALPSSLTSVMRRPIGASPDAERHETYAYGVYGAQPVNKHVVGVAAMSASDIVPICPCAP